MNRSPSVGTSFSPREARQRGLDPARAFQQVLEMGFGLVRVSAYWDELDAKGFGPLDGLLAAAELANQPLLVTVGMKAMRWPEFYVPAALAERPIRDLRGPVLEFVAATVERFRGSSAVTAWQVENEPLTRPGLRSPVPFDILAAEVAAVRSLDTRPLVLTSFRHFNRLIDWASRPRPWTSVERHLLGLLAEGDVLGLDVYTEIAWRVRGLRRVSRARTGWAEEARAIAAAATATGRRAWVTEAQAEPWRGSPFSPADVASVFRALGGSGFERVLLWGAEHWLWRQARGDPSWVHQIEAILRDAT